MKNLALAVIVLAGFASQAAADVRWRLDFKPVSVGTVTTRGVEGPGNYLFMVAEISNNSGQDAPLRLGVGVDTDVRGRKYRAGFDPVVIKQVEKKLGRKLKTPRAAGRSLADGAKVEVIMTFGKVDPNVDTFMFNVNGLRDRVYVDNYKTWVEDTVYTLTYHRPGDELYRQHDNLKFKGERWHNAKPRRELARR